MNPTLAKLALSKNETSHTDIVCEASGINGCKGSVGAKDLAGASV